MTKKIGLSLVAAAVLAAPAMAEEGFKGEAQIWTGSLQTEDYSLYDTDEANSATKAQAGLKAGYFGKAGAVTYGVNVFATAALLKENQVMVNTSEDKAADSANGTGAWIGEGYVGFEAGGTSIKAGYQKINTPLVNSDNWNVQPNTFLAATAVNTTAAEGMTLVGAYVAQENTTAGGYNDGQYNNFGGGAIALAGITKSTGVYLYHILATDEADAMWNIDSAITAVYADHKMDLGGDMNLALQAGHLMAPDLGDGTAVTALGAKVTMPAGGMKAHVAASMVTDDDNDVGFTKASEGGVKTPLYTSTIGGDGDIAGADDTMAVKAGISTKMSATSLSVNAGMYMHGEKSGAALNGDSYTSTSLDVITKTKVAETGTLFASASMYDHSRGAYSGDVEDQNMYVRVWYRHGF